MGKRDMSKYDPEKDPMFAGIIKGANAHHRRQMEEAEKRAQELMAEAEAEDAEKNK